MNAWEGNEIRLELAEVNVKRTVVEPQGRSYRRDDLADQLVQVCVHGPFDIHVASTDIVYGFVVHQEGAVRVLQGGMGVEHGVVRIHHTSRYLETD